MKIKYGIAKDGKLILLDEDLARLKNTLPFMPAISEDQIRLYTEEEIEQAWDNQWYEKGHAPAMPSEVLAAAIRAKRNALLTQVDIAINKAEDNRRDAMEWRVYRQALRDVPQQPGFPEAVVWPEKPE